MDTMNEPALAVRVASALIMGGGSRGTCADRQTGGANENAIIGVSVRNLQYSRQAP
jgi:hypothetical protein